MLRKLGLALAAGVLLAFSPQMTSTAKAASPADTLVIAKNIDDIISLDPAEAYELSGIEVIANAYDRIMRFEPTDINKLVPGVAESATADGDGKSFTFKIRSGLKFASGNPVTAGDAAWSLQRVVKLNKTPAFLIQQLGWDKDNVDKMVTAPDDATLKVTIGVGYAPSLVYALLGSVVGSVVDSKLALQHVSGDDMANGWLKANSAGGGAYAIKAWKANESVVLEANPNYRGGAAKLKRVVIQHVPEPNAQRLLIEKGDADIARDLSADQIAGVSGNKDIVVTTVPQATSHYIGLNLKTKELQDNKVRQALKYLVDYDGMVNSFLKGGFIVHQAFWPKGFWASLDDNEYNYDPDKAKKLLADAGYPNGFEISLDCQNSSPGIDIAQAVQASMAKGGIKVNIVQSEQKALLTKYRARQHQMLLVYWGPDYMDPHTNASSFAYNTDNSDNPKSKPLAWRNSWDIPDISKMTDAAVAESDPAKREQMYKDLQKKVMDEGAFIIMFQETKQLATRANVKGFVMGPSSDVVYYNLATK